MASGGSAGLSAHRVVADRNRHTVLEKLLLIEPWIGLPELSSVAAAAAGRCAASGDLQQALQPGYLVVHAPSMWRYKQWPVEHFRSLIDGLARAAVTRWC